MIKCPNCETENRDEAKFCAQCGKPLKQPSEAEMPISEQPARETAAPAEVAMVEGEQPAEELPIPKTPPEAIGEPMTPETEQALLPKAPEPLPEGALLHQRRYEIIAFIGSRDGVNEYRAVETEPRKGCSHCQTLNAADSNFCEQCGSDLSDAVMVALSVFLREATSAEFLKREDMLIKRALHHPSIASPLATFTDAPYDERFYAALPEVTGTPLPQVLPEDAETAFAWGHLIADALWQLEANGLGLSCPLKEAVLVSDKGEPVIVTDAILLETCDWKPYRDEISDEIRRWLDAVQANEWIGRTVQTIAQGANWRDIADGLQGLLDELLAPPTLQLLTAQATDVGMRREHNEDSYLTMQFERSHLSHTETLAILAIADGMGGHAAGEVASKLCLQVFATQLLDAAQQWLNFEQSDWHQALRLAAMEANRQVFAQAKAMRNNMGTTLTAVVVTGNKAIFVNVGDSRGYLLSKGKLKQVTKDHSLVQQLVDIGQITPEQARYHPQRNIITRAIGIEADVEVDTFEETLLVGELLLLCSDGLNDMVEDAEIERVLLSEPDLQRAADTLINMANEAGGSDNITVVIAKAESVRKIGEGFL